MTIWAGPARHRDEFHVTWSRYGDVGVLDICGDMDVFGAGVFDGAVAIAIAKGLAIVLDLSGIAFLDRSGLASLRRARRDITASGLGFAATGGPAEVAIRHFDAGDVAALLGSRPTRSDAVASLGA